MKYASITNLFKKWRNKMSETVNAAPKVWVTDGTESVRILETDLEMFLASSPGWRRGRTMSRKEVEAPAPLTSQIEAMSEEAQAPVTRRTTSPLFREQENKLFLVVGTVRMDPQVPGRGGAQADQHRLVWAMSVQEAMTKYQRYFDGLNNFAERYAVINMAVSEAII